MSDSGNKNIDYKKVSMFYLIGNLFNNGMAFITVPIFTRLLSTSDYGIVSTYNSWQTICAMVISCALHMAVRAAFIDYKDQIKAFLSTIVTFTIVWGACLLGIVLLCRNIFRIEVDSGLIIICFIHGLAYSIINDFTTSLMMQYRYKFRTALMVLPNLIGTIIAIVVVAFVLEEKLYLGRIIPSALMYLLFSIIVAMIIYRDSAINIEKEYLKYGLKVSLPLIAHGLALTILSQSDRAMITALADASQTGIYSLVYNFSMIASVITTALEGIFVPWFTQKMKEKKTNEINDVGQDYINLMTYIIIGVVLIGPEVVKLLASETYWEGIAIIPPIIVSCYIIFAYTMYVNVEHFHKKTVNISLNTIIAAGLNILLNFIFIPYYGYVAAAYTTLASYLVSFLLHAYYAKRIEENIFPFKLFARPIVHISISCLIFYVWIDNWTIRWILLLVYELLMLYRERKKISLYLKSMK